MFNFILNSRTQVFVRILHSFKVHEYVDFVIGPSLRFESQQQYRVPSNAVALDTYLSLIFSDSNVKKKC